MRRSFLLLFALCPLLSTPAAEPLKALLITGGCCHDYAKQHLIISQGIQSRANVQVDVIWTDDKSTNPPLPVYDNPDWAKGYHVIIHDECAASMNNKEVLTRILDAHKTIPSIHLHCAMHSFRTGEDRWFKHLGIQSASHGPQEPIAITFVDPEHPITKPLKDWTTIKEELYNNVNIFDGHPLAMGKQVVKGKDVDYVVAWTNEKVGARSFSTTIGHNNDTVADARYLDLITRGLLWACDKLNADYLTPFKGQNKITFVPAKPVEAPKPPPAPPANATGIKATASSEETGKNNFAWCAVDGDEKSRWCASNASYPQWLQLEFEKPQALTGIDSVWENGGVYRYKIEASTDGKTWSTLVDASNNTKNAPYKDDFAKKDGIRFVKIHALGKTSGGWASIREVKLKGPDIKAVAPKLSEAQKKEQDKANDPYAKEGNITPKIVKLTPEQEAAILKDVKVADGFEVSLFANSAAANYPVFVAAAPDGTLYVSSDGNGSLGRNPKRGRVIRLRDLDGDGRADETKVFCEVDAPRGLVWDHDRLYLVHPPHLSEFIDADHDGVAEKQNILVKDIAFGYKDRPADHTTNGLSLGIDGWLYIAGGDFGFMKATGTDGRTLQHRGGGVIRVRPDGTGLEIYSTGTRNILEVAISPLMDIFARDNTNDGGGWNVRFHHFTGLDDHGYPRLYKNFPDECIAPLADYGGGSGCGAVYIDEPGFGEWNNAPFTADWGSGALWHHQVKPKGATFEETRKPEPFIKMPRPTDADVDGNSRVYCASWKGATFNWEGPDVGYIVQVKPKGFKAEPLPDFAKAKDEELVKVLESASYRRRMEAQRELARRGMPDSSIGMLSALMKNATKPISARAAASLAFSHSPDKLGALLGTYQPEADDVVFGTVGTRLIAEAVRASGQAMPGTPNLPESCKTPASLVQLNRMMAAADGWSPDALKHVFVMTLGSDDAVVQHTAIRSIAALRAQGVAFDFVDDNGVSPSVRGRALRALAMMHQPEVVTGLIERLGKTTDPVLRQGILAALCRLHFHEGEWKGDSWGTRPDTRGPYYQPEAWSETPKIAAALKDALAKASPEEAAFLVKEMNLNRIQSNDALERILVLAKKDAKVIPDAVAQLATADAIPADAVPLLLQALQEADKSVRAPVTLSQAIIALAKTDSAEGVSATLAAFDALKKMPESGKDYEAATNAFFNAPKLENHHQLVERIAEKMDGKTSLYADAALLNLANRKSGSPESIQLSQKALDAGWADAKRRKQIVEAIGLIKHMPSAGKVLTALNDPDPAVKKAADNAAKSMRLNREKDTTPLVSTLKPEEVLEKVLKMKGDVVTGEMAFTKATCIACHTTSESQPQKGPYLGNIAQTYKRPELAQNILDPNKTIAQGFASEVITLNDGTQQMGFITLESADNVKLRNVAAQEFTFAVKDIKSRQKLPISIMPPGLANMLTLREFASLLDYLEALAKK
ncbi:MAG: discoidin domain-containing protein [Verrucomicrobiaceae bacterium]